MTTDRYVQVPSSPPQEYGPPSAPPLVSREDVQGGPGPATVTKSEVKPVRARAARRPGWWTHPPLLAAVLLGVLVIELVTYALLGPLWWAIANLVTWPTLLAVALAWRRKGRSGAGRSARGNLGRSIGRDQSRTGGAGGGRYPGNAGTGSTGRLAALRSKLPRVLGGTRGRTTGGTSGSGRPPTSAGSSKPGRLANFRSKVPSALGGTRNRKSGSGSSGTPAGRKFGLPGLRNFRTGSSGKKTPGTGSRTGSGTGSTTGTKGGTKGGSSAPVRKPTGSKPGGKWNPLNWKPRPAPTAPKTAPKAPAGGAAPGRGTPPSPGPGRKPTPGGSATRPGDKPKMWPAPDDPHHPSANPKKNPEPATPAARDNPGGNDMSDPMPYSDDQSLQRAGSNLAAVEQAAAEVRAAYAAAEAKAARFNHLFGRMHQQMENDLPAASSLKAEMESTQTQAQRATSADGWRGVEAQAATLPAVYRREHETDEDRLAGGRGGRHKEKRADVAYAEQDN